MLTPILKIAFDILGNAKTPLHVNDIAEIAVRTNSNMGLSVDDLALKLARALAANLQTKNPIFVKPQNKNGSLKRGVYRLKKQIVKAPVQAAPKFSDLTSSYLGKAGEYAVMSELLFWGFNVSLMAVDDGIDIVATKLNKYFHIQVKATTERPDATHFVYTIKKDAFEANNNSSIFYILVLRYMKKTEFIVLPSTFIYSAIKLGSIVGSQSYSLRVNYNEKQKRFYLNNKDDLSPYTNSFDQIR